MSRIHLPSYVVLMTLWGSTVGLASSAAATEASSEPTILALDLRRVNVSAELAGVLDGSLGAALAGVDGVQVITFDDLESGLDVEARKEAIGCDDTGCLEELAGALDTDYVIHGQVAQLGDVVVMQLNLFDAEKARALNRVEVRAEDLGVLSSRLPSAAKRLVEPLAAGPSLGGLKAGPGLFMLVGGGALGAVGLFSIMGAAAVVAGGLFIFGSTTNKDLRGATQIAGRVATVVAGLGLLAFVGGIGVAAGGLWLE